MSQPKNIIKKMTVDVETNSMAIGLQIKDDISGFLRQNIFPKIDQLVNKNIPDTEIWKYDRIEIDLSLDEGQNLDLLTAKIVSDFEQATGTSETKKGSERVQFNRKIPLAKSNIYAFKEYLIRGKYPWWFDTKSTINAIDILESAPQEIKELSFDDLNSINSLKRIIYQLTNQEVTLIYKVLDNQTIGTLVSASEIPKLIRKNEFKEQFWKALFQFKSNNNKVQFIRDFNRLIANHAKKGIMNDNSMVSLDVSETKKFIELCEFCIDELDVHIIPEIVNSNELRVSHQTNKANAKSELQTTKKEVNSWAREANSSEDIIRIAISADSSIKKENYPKENEVSLDPKMDTFNTVETPIDRSFEIDENDGLLVENAGLVLIHPFIKHFFQNLDLLDGNQIQEDKIDKAVHILHYLATKKEQPFEYELIFEKFLCGIPEDYPLKRFISLTNKEKESCTTLLEAMLSHWDALKTNSVDALRSEFLMRDGKLTVENELEKLYVERKTQDILLDRLPWNISMVKLPWKTDMLYVEW